MASHLIWLDFKSVKLKNYLWRRSKQIQTGYSLTIIIQKLLVARWRASPSNSFDKSLSKTLCSNVASYLVYVDLETYVFENPLWGGSEPFDISWFETYKLENYPWRRSEPIQTRYSLTIDIQKLLVAMWRARHNSCFDKSFLKILCSEMTSH